MSENAAHPSPTGRGRFVNGKFLRPGEPGYDDASPDLGEATSAMPTVGDSYDDAPTQPGPVMPSQPAPSRPPAQRSGQEAEPGFSTPAQMPNLHGPLGSLAGAAAISVRPQLIDNEPSLTTTGHDAAKYHDAPRLYPPLDHAPAPAAPTLYPSQPAGPSYPPHDGTPPSPGPSAGPGHPAHPQQSTWHGGPVQPPASVTSASPAPGPGVPSSVSGLLASAVLLFNRARALIQHKPWVGIVGLLVLGLLGTGLAWQALAGSGSVKHATTPTQQGNETNAGSVATTISFSTPSKNIACRMTPVEARCDINEKHWQADDKPDSCQQRWGSTLRVDANKASPACVSDSLLGVGTVLEYGNSRSLGDFTCSSSQDGVTCKNVKTKHGFLISKATFDLF